jgi:membrane protein required for colicin V production
MDNLPINITDIVVGVVLLISALLAYARGFVHEVLSVLGWVGAIFATIYGYPYVKPYARDLIPIDLIADLAAGVAIFILTLVVLSLLTRGIAKMVKDSALNILDRSLGFLFGIVRGAVIVCIAYLALSWLVPPVDHPAWVQSARSMPLIRVGSDILKTFIPEDAAAAGNKAAGNVKKKADKMLELGDMLNMVPKGAEKKRSEGYNRGERREMERLIEGNQ